jgi:hypothetical protein
LSFNRIWALISCAVHALPSIGRDQSLSPMCRFTDRIVRSGFVMAWRLATSPTRISPFLENPTTDGVVRAPSAFGTTAGSPASNTATTEFVVPRSIPTARVMETASSSFETFIVRHLLAFSGPDLHVSRYLTVNEG